LSRKIRVLRNFSFHHRLSINISEHIFKWPVGKQWGQVFIHDNRIGNNGLSEPQNAQGAKLLAPVIFMLAVRIWIFWEAQTCFTQ
jgi:hypothetical protein